MRTRSGTLRIESQVLLGSIGRMYWEVVEDLWPDMKVDVIAIVLRGRCQDNRDSLSLTSV
jgi:hypothetical protein